MPGQVPAKRPDAGTVFWGSARTPLGSMCVAMGANGVLRSAFCRDADSFAVELARRGGRLSITHATLPLAPVWEQLQEYFAGVRLSFTVPLDLSALAPFQREVLEFVSRIPAGKVMTYGAVAAALGRPSAARAVGQANSRNPLAVLIPCHRLVGSDGSLRGYAGPDGVGTKRALLALEGWKMADWRDGRRR
jgi:methylated-DNA-[protein]-cysteine S-methyltransferase